MAKQWHAIYIYSKSICIKTQNDKFVSETWIRGISHLPLALSGHSAITLPPAYLLYPWKYEENEFRFGSDVLSV